MNEEPSLIVDSISAHYSRMGRTKGDWWNNGIVSPYPANTMSDVYMIIISILFILAYMLNWTVNEKLVLWECGLTVQKQDLVFKIYNGWGGIRNDKMEYPN